MNNEGEIVISICNNEGKINQTVTSPLSYFTIFQFGKGMAYLCYSTNDSLK